MRATCETYVHWEDVGNMTQNSKQHIVTSGCRQRKTLGLIQHSNNSVSCWQLLLPCSRPTESSQRCCLDHMLAGHQTPGTDQAHTAVMTCGSRDSSAAAQCLATSSESPAVVHVSFLQTNNQEFWVEQYNIHLFTLLSRLSTAAHNSRGNPLTKAKSSTSYASLELVIVYRWLGDTPNHFIGLEMASELCPHAAKKS